MKVSKIRNLSEIYCGVSIPDDLVISLVNEALHMIGDLALVYDDVSLNAQASTWIELPEDTVSIESASKDGKPYSGFTTQGLKIKFDEEGQFVVTIRRMPKEVEMLTDEPECHPMFHRAIVTYVRGMMKKILDDNSADGQMLLAQFTQEVDRVANMLQRTRKR